MRQLIDVKFADNTSYPAQVGADVGGIVIDCPWGPTEKITRVDLNQFLSQFPLSQNSEILPSQLNAYRALLAGMQSLK